MLNSSNCFSMVLKVKAIILQRSTTTNSLNEIVCNVVWCDHSLCYLRIGCLRSTVVSIKRFVPVWHALRDNVSLFRGFVYLCCGLGNRNRTRPSSKYKKPEWTSNFGQTRMNINHGKKNTHNLITNYSLIYLEK